MEPHIVQIAETLKAEKKKEFWDIWADQSLTDAQKKAKCQELLDTFPQEYQKRINTPYS